MKTVLVALLLSVASAEWVSDIATNAPIDDRKALVARAENFWMTLLHAAEDVNLNAYEDLLDSVDGIVDALPAENAHVAGLLRSSAERLRRTSKALFLNAVAAGEVAGEKLSQGFLAKRSESVGLSFGEGVRDVFSLAIRRFKSVDSGPDGSTYDEEAFRGVAERQGDVLPILKQTGDISGDILTDCRLARKEAYDVLKYDIYVAGAPKTPASATDLAEKLASASTAMRKRFMNFATASVKDIADDTATKDDSPAKVLASATAKTENDPEQLGLELVIST